MRVAEIPDFAALSDREKLVLAEEIKGSLENPDSLPVKAVHETELNRRWDDYLANPQQMLSAEQFRVSVGRGAE
jgi:putative addiction module component (TIGR02574 family)